MIAIVDYNAGNIRSVQRAFEYAGADCLITSSPDEILSADGVILPGVGAFRDCFGNLEQRGLDRVVCQCIGKGMPFLGICLGFQMLFEYSEENGTDGGLVKGMGVFKGAVRRFPPGMGLKVPQIGWNSLDRARDCVLFDGLPTKPYVYFVHSYYVDAKDRSLVAARSQYGLLFDAAIARDRIFAVQFHPEKSGDVGIMIIKNFLKVVYGV
ncbi:MAG TPA: imidazole glycerol phosphate synthase subunit HisH [Thermoclostridium sp.]|nr:imidazole glycerol phosphate synthase subunit HisH [Clostridiaceae bacterium]HOQ76023.1 imidazole glycerol phosphate synthase subunit HisH [Thermoclostridium sp.]HPU45810.1 imidazole glycerol phosphate synthase subunit HisH [Thermoclostridium sp.]